MPHSSCSNVVWSCTGLHHHMTVTCMSQIILIDQHAVIVACHLHVFHASYLPKDHQRVRSLTSQHHHRKHRHKSWAVQAFAAYAGPTVLFSALSLHTTPELAAILLDLLCRCAEASADMTAACVELRAIPTALSLLKDKTASLKVQAMAATLLAEICRGDPDNQRLLRRGQVISALMTRNGSIFQGCWCCCMSSMGL